MLGRSQGLTDTGLGGVHEHILPVASPGRKGASLDEHKCDQRWYLPGSRAPAGSAAECMLRSCAPALHKARQISRISLYLQTYLEQQYHVDKTLQHLSHTSGHKFSKVIGTEVSQGRNYVAHYFSCVASFETVVETIGVSPARCSENTDMMRIKKGVVARYCIIPLTPIRNALASSLLLSRSHSRLSTFSPGCVAAPIEGNPQAQILIHSQSTYPPSQLQWFIVY